MKCDEQNDDNFIFGCFKITPTHKFNFKDVCAVCDFKKIKKYVVVTVYPIITTENDQPILDVI